VAIINANAIGEKTSISHKPTKNSVNTTHDGEVMEGGGVLLLQMDA